MVLDSSHWVTGFGTWKAGEFQLNTNGTEAVGSLALPIPAYVISMSDKSVLCLLRLLSTTSHLWRFMGQRCLPPRSLFRGN